MTKDEIYAHIEALADEMDANEEENRMMQREIDILYEQLSQMEDV
jgi:pyrroloquinoline quinone (PQQ) biosynthesis protein C